MNFKHIAVASLLLYSPFVAAMDGAKHLSNVDDAAYLKLLDKVASPWSDCSTEQRAEILNQVHDWSMVHNPQKLALAYRLRVSQIDNELLGERYNNATDAKYGELCDALGKYAAVDHTGAYTELHDLIKCEILKRFSVCPQLIIPAFPIMLFKLLKEKWPDQFKTMAHEAVTEKLPTLLLLAITHPERMRAFEKTSLSTAHLVHTTLNRKKCAEPFKILCNHGQSLHVQFEQQIAERLSTILQQLPEACNPLISLFESPSSLLQKAAFDTLLASISHKQADEFWKEVITRKILFEHAESAPVGEAELYTELFEKLKTCEQLDDCFFDTGMQLLIQQAMQKPACKSLTSSLIEHYFDTYENTSINAAFCSAIRTKKLTNARLSSILAVAQKTGFARCLVQGTLQEVRCALVQDESVDLAKRAQFFDEILWEGMPDNFTSALVQLRPRPFQQHVDTIIHALNNASNQATVFADRAQLVELAKQHPQLPAKPQILTRIFGSLFCALEENKEAEKPFVQVENNREFVRPFFPDGALFFGYVHYKGSYKLYACRKETGLPVWASPLLCESPQPCTITDKSLLCVTEANSIAQIDLASGEVVQKLPLQEDTKIAKLCVADSRILYAINEMPCRSIRLFNLVDGTRHTVEPPEDARPDKEKAGLVGTALVMPAQKSFLLVSDDGNTRSIPQQTRKVERPAFISDGRFLFYEKIAEASRAHSLACLELATGNHLWEHQLDSFVQAKLTPDGSTIFVLTKRALMALATSPSVQNRLRWQTPLAQRTNSVATELDSILLSNDAATLYGLSEDYGDLYRFDSQTGKKEFLCASKLGRATEFVGTFNNKPYLRGVSY